MTGFPSPPQGQSGRLDIRPGSTPYRLGLGDVSGAIFIVSSSSGAFTVPSAAKMGKGAYFRVKNALAASANLTLTFEGSDLDGGSSSFVVSGGSFDTTLFYSDGTSWYAEGPPNGVLISYDGVLGSPADATFTSVTATNLDGILGGVTPAAATVTALIATTVAGGLDGILGGNTPAAATVTTLAVSGAFTLTGALALATSNALTAAGTTRADALALTKQVNRITTAASGTGVTLPAGVVGVAVFVFNDGANPVQVYGAGSNTIDGVTGTTGVPLANAKRAIFLCVATNTYISAQLGVVSA